MVAQLFLLTRVRRKNIGSNRLTMLNFEGAPITRGTIGV
jgi:hypothetical protein